MIKKNIVWFTTDLDNGAVSNIFFLIVPFLKKEYKITFVSIAPLHKKGLHKKAENFLKKHTITVVSLGCKKTQIYKGIKKLINVLRDIKPDIVHVHLGRAYIIAACTRLIVQKLKIKKYKNMQNIIFFATFHNNFKYFNIFTRYALRMFISNFHSISAVSQTCLNTFYSLLYKKMCKTSVIYNPVALLENETAHNAPLASIRDTHCITLLCVSRLYKGKGHKMLFKMYGQLIKTKWFQNKGYTIELLCAGDGPLRKSLEKTIVSKKLSTIQLLGHRRDIKSLIKQADLLLFPSQDEGFGIVPCESFLQNTPVIMQKSAVAQEIFKHSCWYTNCNDSNSFCNKIIQMIEDKIVLKNFVKEEKQSVEKRFDPAVIAKNYSKWYKNLFF